jgi:hypothetical protein
MAKLAATRSPISEREQTTKFTCLLPFVAFVACQWVLPGRAIYPHSMTAGTTVIALRYHDLVILAADAEVTREDGSHGTACKIAQNGDVFASHVGLIWSREAGLNVDSEEEKAIKQGGTLPQIADRYQSSVRQKLQTALELTHTQTPRDFKAEFDNRGQDAIFVQWVSGQPAVSVREFWIKAVDKSVRLTQPKDSNTDCPGLGCFRSSTHYYFGVDKSVKQLANSPGFWGKEKDQELYDGIMRLMGEQHRLNPDVTGPPYAILRIDKLGPEWLLGARGACDKLRVLTPDELRKNRHN